MTASSHLERLAASRLSAAIRAGADRWTRGVRAAVLCVVLALAVYAVEGLAWSLHEGRDSTTYLMYWVDMWNSRPVFPELMLYRTPIAPLLLGPLLQYGGGTVAEAGMGLAFAASVLAVGAAAYSLRRAWGILTVAALLLAPDYSEVFREVSSDSAFAFVFALWLYLVVRVVRRPSLRGFVAAGAGVALLVLARPAGQTLVVVAALAFVVPGSIGSRVVRAGACAATAVGLLAVWSGVNYVRYDDFTVSRTVTAQLPLNRLFLNDKLVSPENGPRSRELARVVRRDLLTREPYRSYHVTLDQFFSSGSFRMYSDLVSLSDRVWGWSSDYSRLRAVGIETVRAHPLAYARGVLADSLLELRLRNPTPATVRGTAGGGEDGARAAGPTVVIRGRRLPKPSEGDLIPRSHLWWLASTPDGRISNGPGLLAPFRFRDARDAQHAAWLYARVGRLQAELPPRSGSQAVARLLERWSRLYPPMLLWILVGAAGLFVRRERALAIPALLAALGVAVVVATELSQTATAQYRIPFDPVFVLVGVAGVVGSRPLRLRLGQRLRHGR